MEGINCCAFESDKDVSKLGLQELCNKVSFLKPLNVPAWRPEFVATTRKDEILVIGMVEHKKSCSKMEEAIKQVFGKDLWELLLGSREDAKCLTYLSTIGPLFSLFAIAKAEKVSGKCCLPIDGIKTLRLVVLLCCSEVKEKRKDFLTALKLMALGISYKEIQLKKMESKQHFTIMPILLIEEGKDLKLCAKYLVDAIGRGLTS